MLAMCRYFAFTARAFQIPSNPAARRSKATAETPMSNFRRSSRPAEPIAPRPLRRRALSNLGYAAGLLLVFILSLLLLPRDSGLGRLLWGSL